MAGSNVGTSVGFGRSRRKSMLVLSLAACVALAAILVAQAGAVVPMSAGTFGGNGSGAGALRSPSGLAVSSDGRRVYVADTGNNRIDEFTAEGEFLRAWGWGVRDGESELQTCDPESECLAGQAGKGAGQLNEPFGVAVRGNTVYAENRAKGDGRVLKFSIAGKTVTSAGALPAGYGADGAGRAGLTYPLPPTNDVAIGPSGQVYVADNVSGASRIVIFPTGGSFTSFEVGSEAITAIAAAKGRLYVATGYNQITVYGPGGGLIEKINTTRFIGEFSAIAINPLNGNLLVEPKSNGGPVVLTELTEKGEELRQVPATEAPERSEEINPFGLAFSATAQFEDSKPGAIYVGERGVGAVRFLVEPEPGEPVAEFVKAENVGTDGANLSAFVNPKGNDTHVYFEYGTTAAYGSTAPATPGVDIGDGFESKSVSTHLYGLAPNTTYHYAVVATSPGGTQTLEGGTFTTFPIGGPFALPDGRAYEQVTTDKGTANVGGLFSPFASPADGGVAFGSAGPLPGSSSGVLNSAYVALRDPAGWSTYGSDPPVNDALGAYFLISPDLRQSVGYSEKDLGGNPPSGSNLYLRDNLTGTETLMTPLYLGGIRSYRPYGTSANFRHIVFEGESRLTVDTPEDATESLYEFSDGSLKNIGVLPGATTPSGSVAKFPNKPPHLVSEDGSRVFFAAEPAPGEATQVFARIEGTHTIELSASQAGEQDPEGAQQAATFVGASADGRFAFFTSSARLTDDAFTGSNSGTGELEDRSPNLYRYDLATNLLIDLTVARGGGNEELGAAITGAVLPSADGSSAYFVAQGELAPGGTAGKPNLYRWAEGGGIRFVANLNEGDLLTSEGSYDSAPSAIARTTSDGSVFAFTAQTPLDPAFPVTNGTREIYLYSAAGGIVCVSCARSETSLLEAFIAEPSSVSSGYGGNVLSSDGARLFFQTAAALVPQDTNGIRDVYEWENGSAHLISSGTGSGGSLIDASASGNDVYFTTDDQLVPGDGDGYADVYDAKVGGGLPGPPVTPAPCEAAGCRSAQEAVPSGSVAGSRLFNGPHDKKAKHHRRKHKMHKKNKRHRKQAKHRKHTRSHGHPSVGKRG